MSYTLCVCVCTQLIYNDHTCYSYLWWLASRPVFRKRDRQKKKVGRHCVCMYITFLVYLCALRRCNIPYGLIKIRHCGRVSYIIYNIIAIVCGHFATRTRKLVILVFGYHGDLMKATAKDAHGSKKSTTPK